MVVRPDCVPCYLKQGISTLRAANVHGNDINDILYKVLDMLPSMDLQSTPGEKTFFVLRAKCPIVAECLEAELGNIVLKRNGYVGIDEGLRNVLR